MTRCKLRLWALAGCVFAGSAGAVSLGQVDDFSSGTAGWSSGVANPFPPVVLPGGGPGGAADPFLAVASTGAFGPASKLVVLAGPQWGGDYLAAGVTALRMDLANFGNTDLTLRLRFEGTGVLAWSRDAVLLPAQSGWQSVLFPLAGAALDGNPAAALAATTLMRLYHGGAAFPPQPLAASLGIATVAAVPEPATALLAAAGALLLLAALRRGGPAR